MTMIGLDHHHLRRLTAIASATPRPRLDAGVAAGVSMKTTTGRENFCASCRTRSVLIALGTRSRSCGRSSLLGVAPLLVAEEGDGLSLVLRQAGDDGVVVREPPVAVQLVHAGGTAARHSRAYSAGSMTRHQHALPGRQVLEQLPRISSARRRSESIDRSRARAFGSMLSAPISFSNTPTGSSNSSSSAISSFLQEVRRPGGFFSKELLISCSCSKLLSQNYGSGAAKLLHFLDKLFGWSNPLSYVGADAESGPLFFFTSSRARRGGRRGGATGAWRALPWYCATRRSSESRPRAWCAP